MPGLGAPKDLGEGKMRMRLGPKGKTASWGLERFAPLALNPCATPLLLGLCMVVAHLGLWYGKVVSGGVPWGVVVSRWDGNWLTSIAVRGYGAGNPQGEPATEEFVKGSWAFYPLYPACMSVLGRVFGGIPLRVWGALLSSACFFLALVVLASSRLRPRSSLGWAFFILSPASFAFHTVHTEGLFLLLSTCAFVLAERQGRRSLVLASLCAGLCALTRIQGVFVAVAVGMKGALWPGTWRERLGRFAGVGLVSGSLAAVYPLYQWWATGNPFASVAAQDNWPHVSSLRGALKTIWLGNPAQRQWARSLNPMSLRHILFYPLYWILSLALWRTRPHLGLYCVLSLLILLPQGTLDNLFRFTCVLFPLFFFLGDWLDTKSRPFQVACLFGVLCLNLRLALRYSLLKWFMY